MSKIQWTDKTANPLKRRDGGNYCEMVSPGCANCYASVLNSKGTRFGGNGLAFGGSSQERPEMVLNMDMLESWARMRKERRIFVGSMTDVFGEWVPNEMVFTLLDAMAAAGSQTFQLLTKRPERAYNAIKDWLYNAGLDQLPTNIWLGISAEDQQRLDERLIWFIRTPAAVRFLSLEPLLGPVTLPDPDSDTALMMQEDNPSCLTYPIDCIDWMIVGGESGPGARPLKVEWIEDILAQCRAANISMFLKQFGTYWAKRSKQIGVKDGKGGDPDEWPAHLRIRVRMFPGEVWK